MRYMPDYITQEHLDRANNYIASLDDLALNVCNLAKNCNVVLIAVDIDVFASYKESRDKLTFQKSIANPFDVLKMITQHKVGNGNYHKYSLEARKAFDPPMVECEYKEFIQPFNNGPGYETRMLSERYYRNVGYQFIKKVAELQYANQDHKNYHSTYWYPATLNLPQVRLSEKNYIDYMNNKDKSLGGVEYK